jgi:hypothetical protein
MAVGDTVAGPIPSSVLGYVKLQHDDSKSRSPGSISGGAGVIPRRELDELRGKWSLVIGVDRLHRPVSFTPSRLRSPHPVAADRTRSGRHDWDAGIGLTARTAHRLKRSYQ